MRSATWPRHLALTLALAAMGVFAIACSKSSKEKETNTSKSSATTPDGKKTGTTEVKPDNTKNPDEQVTPPTRGTQTDPGTKPTKTVKNGTATNPKSPKKSGYKLLANTPEYTLKLVYPKNLANGASATARVVLTAKKGWKLNEEYPTKLTVVAPSGTKINKAKQKRTDAVRWAKKSAEWQVQISASGAGTKPFSGKFKFAVCTDTTCDPKKELLAWVVNVK